jgi:hypothetical protein
MAKPHLDAGRPAPTGSSTVGESCRRRAMKSARQQGCLQKSARNNALQRHVQHHATSCRLNG